MTKNVIVFASGNGSNAENLARSFKETLHPVSAIFCNNPQAFVLERARKLNIPSETFSYSDFQSEQFLLTLNRYKPDFIILAGFLLKMPPYIVHHFPGRILNIHPALLPKFGGKGMYGEHVHKAVIESGEKHSGITIHIVNEHYDEGAIIFQAKCVLAENETPESLASKIHELEYEHFPKVVANYISDFRD